MVYWPIAFNLVMIMLFWLMSLTCSGPCPDDIMNEVLTCLSNLTHNGGGTGGETLINGGDAKLMYENCEYGGFDDSIQCLTRVYESCNDGRKKEAFYKFASIDAWRSGFRRFCQNINLYMQKKDCISNQDKDIEMCIKKNNEKFPDKPNLVADKDSYQYKQGETVLNTCRFFHLTQYCYSQPIGSQCGNDIRAILLDFTGGITPPVCRTYKVENPSNSCTTCQSPAILLLFCIFLIIMIQR